MLFSVVERMRVDATPGTGIEKEKRCRRDSGQTQLLRLNEGDLPSRLPHSISKELGYIINRCFISNGWSVFLCGITGFAGINSDPSIIASMLGHIKHRGPDHEGYCIHENLAIGMTRLSIVDLNGGSQPIHTPDGTLSIVFNGEIYNYQELASAYQADGGILRTRSDTEIILALYAKEREKCLEKLRGMFAFAILDRREKSLFIARDRIGIKPLYFWHKGRAFVFGSEIKSLLASKQFNAAANLNVIPDYLSLRYVPGPNSLFKDIHRVPAGHWMKWQDGKIQQQRYWQPFSQQKLCLSDLAFQEQFDHLFQESVTMHRMGDVPHGAYLSGGLDSSAIVSTLAQHSSTRVKTFTVGFDWERDELNQAREVANLVGTEHHEVICKPDDFEHLPKLIWHSDEPLGDPIVLPTYMLAQEASKHVKIVLTGEGADEILAGYLFHQAVSLAHQYRRWIPAVLHRSCIKPMIQAMPVGLLNAGFNYPGYLGNSGKQRLISFLDLARHHHPEQLLKFFITLFDTPEKAQLFTPDFLSSLSQHQVSESQIHDNQSILDQLQMLQYTDWLPDNILMRQDKMSMAHGLEARVPFLDHPLVEFMERVPDHLKLKLRRNKVLLRNYAAKHGIKKAAKRKKNAFYFPMEAYAKTSSFQNLLAETLGESKVKARGLFNYREIKNLTQRMENKDFLASKQIFSLISLELWFQIFIDSV